MQISTHDLLSHVINVDILTFSYSILIGQDWLLKFVGVAHFEQKVQIMSAACDYCDILLAHSH